MNKMYYTVVFCMLNIIGVTMQSTFYLSKDMKFCHLDHDTCMCSKFAFKVNMKVCKKCQKKKRQMYMIHHKYILRGLLNPLAVGYQLNQNFYEMFVFLVLFSTYIHYDLNFVSILRCYQSLKWYTL